MATGRLVMTEGKWQPVDAVLEINLETQRVRARGVRGDGAPLAIVQIWTPGAGLLIDMSSVQHDLENIQQVWDVLREAPIEPYAVWKAAYEGMLIAYRRCFNKADSAVQGQRRFIIKGQILRSLSPIQREVHKRALKESNSGIAHREPGHDAGEVRAYYTRTTPPIFCGLHLGASPIVASQSVMEGLGDVVQTLRNQLKPAMEAQIARVRDEVQDQGR